jgi:hypothetical protein
VKAGGASSRSAEPVRIWLFSKVTYTSKCSAEAEAAPATAPSVRMETVLLRFMVISPKPRVTTRGARVKTGLEWESTVWNGGASGRADHLSVGSNRLREASV